MMALKKVKPVRVTAAIASAYEPAVNPASKLCRIAVDIGTTQALRNKEAMTRHKIERICVQSTESRILFAHKDSVHHCLGPMQGSYNAQSDINSNG
jgi:hypothetical protein